MSTPSTPLTPEQLAVVEEAANKQTTPLEVKLSTGQTYKGATQQELMDQLVKAQENATTFIEQQKEKDAAREARLAELEAELSKSRTPPPTTQGTFSSEKYYELLGKDPLLAADYLDGARYGVSPEQVREVWVGAVHNSTEAAVVLQAALFEARCPDYPSTPEASDALLKQLGDRRVSADNMELAWNELKRQGVITPKEEGTEEEKEKPRRAPRLPSGSGGSTPSINVEEVAWTVPITDLEKMIEKQSRLTNK